MKTAFFGLVLGSVLVELIVLAVLSDTSSAQVPPATAAVAPVSAPATPVGSRIQFATLAYDFGQINSGAVVNYEYIFTNTGVQPLIITHVQPSCGCTTAGTWSTNVPPGQTGTIPIQFNSGNFSGSVLKTVTVNCNDTTQPQVTLQLKGTIWKPIDVIPTYVIFNPSADSSSNETKVIRIVNNTETPLTLSAPESANRAFAVELKTIRTNKEFELHVSTIPPLGSGTVQGAITVKTSSTNTPLLAVSAIAIIQPAITVMPEQITLPAGPLPGNSRVGVTVRNNSTSTNVLVTEPVVNLPGVETLVQEIQAGRVFNVQMTFPAGFEMQAGQAAELSLKTTHPQFPVVKVPIHQNPRPTPVSSVAPAVPPLNPGSPSANPQK